MSTLKMTGRDAMAQPQMAVALDGSQGDVPWRGPQQHEAIASQSD